MDDKLNFMEKCVKRNSKTAFATIQFHTAPIVKRSFVPILMTLILLVAAACAQEGNAAQDEIIPLSKGEAQLFVDDYLVESAPNIKRTLHQPKKDDGGNSPILAIEDEFDGYSATLEANGTIVYDSKLKKYVMISLAYSRQWAKGKKRSWDKIRLYRFTSDDGIQWIKGDDGTPQRVFPRSKEDLRDSLSGEYADNTDLFSFYYDKTDSLYPYKGWQHFSNWGGDRSGQYYMFSKDGVQWNRGGLVVNAYESVGNPWNYSIDQNGVRFEGAGDVTTFYHDKEKNRFLAIVKFTLDKKKNNGKSLRSRAYGFFKHPLNEPFDLSTIKHVELVPPAREFNGDMPSDEYYGSTAWRYGSQWLGGLKVWHPEGDYPYSQAGCAFLKLVSSRDGLHWNKVQYKNEDGFSEVFIANGKEGGNDAQNDGGYMTEFSNPPLRIDDQLIFYYASSSWGKNQADSIRLGGGGIFRARLRVDGFVSVDKGTITTRLFHVDAKNLTVNSKGQIKIEVLNNNNKSLGHQLISGDSIEHLVNFEGRPFSDLSKENAVKLRFEVKDSGELYSFKFKD